MDPGTSPTAIILCVILAVSITAILLIAFLAKNNNSNNYPPYTPIPPTETGVASEGDHLLNQPNDRRLRSLRDSPLYFSDVAGWTDLIIFIEFEVQDNISTTIEVSGTQANQNIPKCTTVSNPFRLVPINAYATQNKDFNTQYILDVDDGTEYSGYYIRPGYVNALCYSNKAASPQPGWELPSTDKNNKSLNQGTCYAPPTDRSLNNERRSVLDAFVPQLRRDSIDTVNVYLIEGFTWDGTGENPNTNFNLQVTIDFDYVVSNQPPSA